MNMKKLLLVATGLVASVAVSLACTGISLRSADGAIVMARTIEWGSNELPSNLTIVPRGYCQTSFTPTGVNGLEFKAKYGYVGVSLVQDGLIAEGLNEAGLSAGLFYFPNYGKYVDYDPSQNASSLADLQFVAWVLSQFATVEEVKANIGKVRIISTDTTGNASATAIHWRIGDAGGKQIVVEFEDGEVHIYDNTVGVITNAPDFKWHIQNLNNYVNLFPGAAQKQQLSGQTLSPFGAGTGFLGLPGDVTPPSRFVRAAFYVATAPERKTSSETVNECFTILDNFNIPVGIEYPRGQVPDVPSATQWTSVSDLTNKEFYYKTMFNSTLRKVCLNDIDFGKVKYQSQPLDKKKEQPVEVLKIR